MINKKIKEEWKIVPLSSVCNYSIGRTPPRKEASYWSPPEIPWVSIADMKQGSVITTTKEKISKIAFDKCFYGKIVPKGTLLMSFKLTIGRTCFSGIDAVHNEAIISIKPNSNVDPLYLSCYLSMIDFRSYQDRQVKGFTLNKSKIDKLDILLPSLSEQKRISSILSTIQRRIELQRKIILKLQELEKSTMQYVFTRELD